MRKLTFILLLAVSCFASAQDSLQFFSHTSGAACQSIKYYNGYLITGTGSTLRVYDTSPGIPYPIVWEYWYRSTIMDLLIDGDNLYVAANYDGMTKWDISNPLLPAKVYEIYPDTNCSTQDISISGDTIFLAQFSKMTAYKDYGTTYSKITDFGNTNGFGYITGADVKNGVIAFSQSFSLFWTNGVYFFSTSTFQQLSWHHQTAYYPENVCWGKNNNLLHVMGGTNSVHGYFYSLDASDPSNPQLVYNDTLTGVPLGIAMANPNNAVNINDTIYISTWAAVKHDTVTNGCYIHVYDATNPSNVHFIEYIPAGLWHFDLDVVPPRVYVASEWYGIKTVDITDLHNPVDEGNTVTGGWNIDADKQGDLLAVANEGYGFKLYDVSDVTQPLLRDTDQTPGFCHKIRMSEDAQYIYTCNSSYQGFRVFRSDSLIQTGFVQDAVANHRAEVYNNHVIGSLVFLTISQLIFVDVSDPYAPYIDTIINTPVNDFSVSANGVLFLSANDVLKAWDISGSMVVLLDTVPLGAAEDGMAVAVFDDIFYVFIEGKGLTRYELVLNGSFYELQELSTWNIAYGKPDYMAADAFGLYLGYRLRGLYAFDKNTGTEIDWYRDGLDYRKYTGQYGIQALSCRDSLIVLTEYFSQTSLLTFCNNYPLQDYELRPTGCGLAIYPNPSDGEMTVRFDPKGKPGNYKWGLFSVAGVETAHGSVASGGNETQFRISLGNLSPGVYFFSMYGMQYPGCRKIIIE